MRSPFSMVSVANTPLPWMGERRAAIFLLAMGPSVGLRTAIVSRIVLWRETRGSDGHRHRCRMFDLHPPPERRMRARTHLFTHPLMPGFAVHGSAGGDRRGA